MSARKKSLRVVGVDEAAVIVVVEGGDGGGLTWQVAISSNTCWLFYYTLHCNASSAPNDVTPATKYRVKQSGQLLCLPLATLGDLSSLSLTGHHN